MRTRARWVKRPRNPLTDPIACIKQPLIGRGPAARAVVEFDAVAVRRIREKFGATQREFARLIGISHETLKNWEKGRRRPHGPSRALLRAIDANPFELARALNWHNVKPIEQPDEWWID